MIAGSVVLVAIMMWQMLVAVGSNGADRWAHIGFVVLTAAVWAVMTAHHQMRFEAPSPTRADTTER